MPRLLDMEYPLDPDYPGNKGLVAAWVAVPELAAGLTLFDLTNTGRGNPQHGVLTNGPTWVAGPNSFGAVSFDGSNDYVDVPHSAALNAGQLSVGCLVRINSVVGGFGQRLIAKWDGSSTWILEQASDGNWKFWVNNGGTTTNAASAAAAGSWVFLVGTYDGSNIRLYVNGVNTATTALSGSCSTNSRAISFGVGETYSGQFLAGAIAAGSFYSRALSATEVAALYDQSRREWGQSEQYRWLDGVTYSLPGGGSVSGSAALTDANDATTAAATVAVAASATITDATDTTAGASTVSVTATASLTDATDATSSAATVAVAATASITDATDTTAATGAVSVTATAALVDADDGATATGGSAGGGSAALVDADDAVVTAGAVAVAATASLTDATDTTSGAGTVAVAGSAALTDATDTTTASATVAVAGSVALTDGGDTTTSAATVSVTAAAAISDATDTVTATASDGSTPVGDDTLYMFLAF